MQPTALRTLVTLCAVMGSVAGQEVHALAAEQVAGLEHFQGSDAARELLLRQRFVVVAPASLPDDTPRRDRLLHPFSAYVVDGPLPVFVTPDLLIDAFCAQFEAVVEAAELRAAPRLLAFTTRLHAVARTHDDAAGLAELAALAVALQRCEVGLDDPRVTAALGRNARPLRPDLAATAAYADDATLRNYYPARRLLQVAASADAPRTANLRAAFAACLAADAELRALRDDVVAGATRLVGPPVEDASEGSVLPGATTPWWQFTQHERLPRDCLAMLAMGPLASPTGRRLWHDQYDFGLDLHTPEITAPDSPFGAALLSLAELQRPDPRAAALFHTDAWAELQAATQLAGWAELRHATVLLAQLSYLVLSRTEPPVGRVAPYPAFFRALADAAGRLRREHRALVAREPAAAARARLQADVALLAPAIAHRLRANSQEEARADELLNLVYDLLGDEDLGEEALAASARDAIAAGEGALFDGLRRGRVDVHLGELEPLCRRLADLAERQLAGEPPTDADRAFVTDLGRAVAALHGYDGNSWLGPRDDHARIAPIGRITGALVERQNGAIQVGVARPERLYVILDHDGAPTLHAGAVLSYRELRSDAALTDAQWRERVAADAAPPPPSFTRSFRR